MPKFAKTYCSQCGAEFGPRDSGYSHCDDHIKDAAPDLLEALDKLLHWKTHTLTYEDAKAMARAAIAKARGQ